jgi:hypothetical protein
MAESQMDAFEPQVKKDIARSITDLPPLVKDNVRVVHITTSEQAEEVFNTGLDYEKYGMAMSTARAWEKSEEVEFGSDDPRFNQPGLKAVVMDLSNAEWKLHNRIDKAPGKIPSEKVIGIVDVVLRPQIKPQ